ncbi:plant intracellular Ras-group-related LRR protein 7-like protein [Tanacetum coccineum]
MLSMLKFTFMARFAVNFIRVSDNAVVATNVYIIDEGLFTRIRMKVLSLEELQENENSIEELPTLVCNLIHLKSLCLDNNNLKQVSIAFMSSNSSKFIKRMRDPAEYFFTRQYHIYGSVSTDGGFKEFEDQRKKKFDKQIDSNVMISSKGIDGGRGVWVEEFGLELKVGEGRDLLSYAAAVMMMVGALVVNALGGEGGCVAYFVWDALWGGAVAGLGKRPLNRLYIEIVASLLFEENLQQLEDKRKEELKSAVEMRVHRRLLKLQSKVQKREQDIVLSGTHIVFHGKRSVCHISS